MRANEMYQLLSTSFAARTTAGRAAWGRHWSDPAEQAVYERVTRLAWGLITCPLRRHRRSAGALYQLDVRRRIAPVAEHLAFCAAVTPEEQVAFQVAVGFDPTTEGFSITHDDLAIPACHVVCDERRARDCPKGARVRFARRLARTLAWVLDYQLPYDLSLGMPRLTVQRPPYLAPAAEPCRKGCQHGHRRRRGG